MKDFKNTLKKLDEATQEKEIVENNKGEETPKEKKNPTKEESTLDIEEMLKTFENEELNSMATFTYRGTKAFNNYVKAFAYVKRETMKDIYRKALHEYIIKNSSKEEQKRALEFKKEFLD